jgi:hypothetical protein
MFSGMEKRPEIRSLLAGYRMPGVKTMARVKQEEKDPTAFVLTLARRQKKQAVGSVGRRTEVFMIGSGGARVTSVVVAARSLSTMNCAVWSAKSAAA